MIDAAALRRLRRGVGVICVLAGLVHLGQNLFAVLWATGRLRVRVDPMLWAAMHRAHFMLFIFAGLGYLTLSFRREGIFYYEALADYLAGLGGFLVLMTAAAALIVARVVSPWASLVPGGLLILYGGGLCAGRAFGWKKNAELPPA